MPVPVPELGQFNYVQETKVSRSSVDYRHPLCASRLIDGASTMQENLDWADLVTLDFSKYGTPEGKKELAQELIKAVREDGFFYVKNFNITQERVNRQFSLGKRFYELPLEEKLKYVPDGLGTSFIHHVGVLVLTPSQIMAHSTDTSPLAVACEYFCARSLRLVLSIRWPDSLDPESGLRDRTEIYNIPSE